MANVDRAAGRQIPPLDHVFDYSLILLGKITPKALTHRGRREELALSGRDGGFLST